MAKVIGPAPDALTNEQIIAKYNQSLTQATKAMWDPQTDFERIALISQARQQWMMIRGQQNFALGWSQDSYGGMQADYVPFDSGSGQEETGADIKLCPPVNFLGGDCFKFMAVMGNSSPRVKAVADDMRDEDDEQAAHCADINIRDLWVKNRIDRKWKIPAFHMYATGPCFIRGFWNTDATKYGQTTEPEIAILFGADGSPIPVITGERTYDNGDAEVSFHSVLEVVVPWEAKELRGNPLFCERMVSKWSLLATYKGKDGEAGPLDQYRDGDVPDDQMHGSSVAASEARTATSNPSGTAQTRKLHHWRLSEWWLPPYLFEAVLSSEARKVLKTQFSRGIYIARVGSITVEIDEREVTEEWTVAPVNRDEKIMSRPVCADNVPLQRAINDLLGMSMETVLRAITRTLIDNQLIDRQAMSTREALPAEMILTAIPVDGDLRDKIFQVPPAHLSDQVLPLLNAVRAWGQDISGVRPELSGGGAPTSTFREAKQRKDQALAQLAPQAQAMRDAAEDLAKILVDLRAKYGSGTVKASRRGSYGKETDITDMSELKTCGWHTESDDQYPLTLSDKRDAVYSLLTDGMNQEVLQALSILDPMNVEELVDLLGVPGFSSAISEQKHKTMNDVSMLLEGAPTPGAPGPDGQPGPPQPSVPVDMFDNHPLVADILAKWLVSPYGQKYSRTPGFDNVVAFWDAHNKLAQPPTPPPPPAIKGSVSWTGKLEDFPNLVPEILHAEGLSVPPPPAPPAPPPVQMAGAHPMPQQAPPPPGGRPPEVSPIPQLTGA